MTKHERYEAVGMLRIMSLKYVAAQVNVHIIVLQSAEIKGKVNQTREVVDQKRVIRPTTRILT